MEEARMHAAGARFPAALALGLAALAPACAEAASDYLTVVGGSDDDIVFDVAADANGNLYVTGETKSADLPVTGAIQSMLRGTHDAFVLKLDPAGNVVYLTYLGGSGFDSGRGIDVDAAGNAYVTGYTESVNFPVQNALDANRGGFADAFVSKIGPQGNSLLFSTYFGGSNSDNGEAIAVDSAGRIYVAGRTAGGLTPINAAQSTLGGVEDAFVIRLNAGHTAIDYTTYLGGNFTDFANAIAADAAGRACVAGFSQSTVFPEVNPSQVGSRGAADAFYAVIGVDGSTFVVASLLGGTGQDEARGVACDSARLAVVGDTRSTDFPTGSSAGGSFQSALAGGLDGFSTTITIASGAIERERGQVYLLALRLRGNDDGNPERRDGDNSRDVCGWRVRAGRRRTRPRAGCGLRGRRRGTTR
jgi:hypothetical protein